MKISKQTVDNVQGVDIIQLAEDLGFQGIKRRGARHIALCPWHNDEHASCHIGGPGSYAHVVKCFACGGSAGSNIDLVMKIKGLSFRDAVLWLASQYGIAVEEETEAKDKRQKAKVFSRACHPEQRGMAKDKRLRAKVHACHPERNAVKSKDPTPTLHCHQPAELAGDSSTAAKASVDLRSSSLATRHCSCEHDTALAAPSVQNDGPGENPQPSARHLSLGVTLCSQRTFNPQPKSYATLSKVRKHVSPGNALCLCLKDFFPSDVVDHVTKLYQLGTDYAVDSRCHTLFPSIDRWGRVHDVKLQVYDINRSSARYGHSQATYWVGKRLLLREDGTEYDRDTECLFGEHLLALRPSDVVGLVESPKNAIVCACQWPELVWVATGNKGMLKRNILRPLQGRQVLVYPDRDAHEEWITALETMQDIATFCISDILHDFPMEKGDIADLILSISNYQITTYPHQLLLQVQR